MVAGQLQSTKTGHTVDNSGQSLVAAQLHSKLGQFADGLPDAFSRLERRVPPHACGSTQSSRWLTTKVTVTSRNREMIIFRNAKINSNLMVCDNFI